jgi:shikimate dehydrogenase
MLLHQAAAQFQIYTGRAPPLDAMDRALRETMGGSW